MQVLSCTIWRSIYYTALVDKKAESVHKDRKRLTKHLKKGRALKTKKSDSQFRLNLDDGSDAIGAICIGNGGVLFSGIIAEQ